MNGKRRMADFFEEGWNGYTLKLRPNDKFRELISRLPYLLDVLPYFSSSYISFDMRLFVPRKVNRKWYSPIASLFPEYNRRESAIFNYEWELCDDNYKPVTSGKVPRYFYNNSGHGQFKFNTDKAARKELERSGYAIVSDNMGHWFRKKKAIDIGRLNKHTHYNILIRFTTVTGVSSDWKLMAQFKLFDKDDFRMSGCLPIIISFIVTVLTVFVLKSCGLQ